jgi:hypothetical protein
MNVGGGDGIPALPGLGLGPLAVEAAKGVASGVAVGVAIGGATIGCEPVAVGPAVD